MEIKRQNFQGVLNILSFNRHFYVIGFIALALIIGSKFIFNWSNGLYWLIILAFIYGLTMSLFVSAYVYDFSGFYNFDWLEKMIEKGNGSCERVRRELATLYHVVV